MNVVKQHYIIDFSSDNNFMQISAMQGDGYEVRYAEIEMIENGQPYTVEPSEVDVSIMGTKPDTKEIWNSCEVTQEGYILVEITQQMTAVLGRGEYSIVISHKSQNRQIKSFPFNIITTKAPYDPSYIESTDEFQRLLAAIDDASSGRVMTINNIGDVKVNDPQNNQVLKFNSTSHKWENQTDETGGGGSTVTITPVLSSGTKIANYNINGTDGSLYAPNSGGSGGSTVSISPSLSSGTKIADYTIDGATGSLYAPSGGGGSISTPVSISNGGTGATTAANARTNLGLGSLAEKSAVSLNSSDTSGILPISKGGTGNSDGFIRAGQKSGTTIGTNSTAEGYNTTASGNYSHASGNNTIASADNQTVVGKYNAEATTGLFVIGNGTSDSNRSNLANFWDNGTSRGLSIAGDLSISGLINLGTMLFLKCHGSVISYNTDTLVVNNNKGVRFDVTNAVFYIIRTTTWLSSTSSIMGGYFEIGSFGIYSNDSAQRIRTFPLKALWTVENTAEGSLQKTDYDGSTAAMSNGGKTITFTLPRSDSYCYAWIFGF